MAYPMLKQLEQTLQQKLKRSTEEEALLKELVSLDNLISKTDFSLAMSNGVCPSCGRPFSK